MTALLAALSGANLIFGMGMLESGVTFSHTQLVIDNEIANMCKRVVRGIEVSDATLAVDLIRTLGGGQSVNYLTEMHTMEHMQSEQSRAWVFDRRMRENWELEINSRDAAQQAELIARDILNTHKPEPMDPVVLRELRRIVDSKR